LSGYTVTEDRPNGFSKPRPPELTRRPLTFTSTSAVAHVSNGAADSKLRRPSILYVRLTRRR